MKTKQYPAEEDDAPCGFSYVDMLAGLDARKDALLIAAARNDVSAETVDQLTASLAALRDDYNALVVLADAEDRSPEVSSAMY